MHWLALTLVFLVGAAVSSVAGRPAAAPDGRFRVATFNVHKGADRGEHYDLLRTTRAIAGLEADLVGVQEVLRNHAGYLCDDQPALIEAGLERLTGRRWSHAYEGAWNTENLDCLRSGRGDGVETEGLALFAPERIIATRSIRLSEGRVGLAARLASIPEVSVAVTHLSASREGQAGRARELALLLPWAEKHRAGIVMGDFNAVPQAGELAPVFSRYRDAWSVAAEQGSTAGVPSGATRPGRRLSRIDYVFFDPNVALTLESVEVIDTSSPTSPDTGEVSDHRPVVATFRRVAR